MTIHYAAALTGLLSDPTALTPHPRNPRNGDVDAIMESIRVNGCYRPIYAQRSTGRILAGNHTYAALMELGADRVPVLWLDVDDRVADRIMVADNRTAELGQWDNGLLLELLTELDASEGLLGTGFDADYLTTLDALVAEAEVTDFTPHTDPSDDSAVITIKVPYAVKVAWDAHLAEHGHDPGAALTALLDVSV